MALANISVITNNSPVPHLWRILLDGQDISTYIRKIVITGEINKAATIELTLAGKLNIPDVVTGYLTVKEDTNGKD